MKVQNLENRTIFLCNVTNSTCETTTNNENLAFALPSVFLLCIAFFIGGISNIAFLRKLIVRNWRKNFPMIQLLITGFVVCGFLAPLQIVRVAVTYEQYHDILELCYFHHFLHLSAESCTFVITIIIACERLITISTNSENATKLTYKKITVTCSWILVLPVATYIIHQDNEKSVVTSIFSNDCVPGRKNDKNEHLVESVSAYAYIFTFVVMSIMYTLCICNLWRKKLIHTRRINPDPFTNSTPVTLFIPEPCVMEARCENLPNLPLNQTVKATEPGEATGICAVNLQEHPNDQLLSLTEQSSGKALNLTEKGSTMIQDMKEEQSAMVVNLPESSNMVQNLAENPSVQLQDSTKHPKVNVPDLTQHPIIQIVDSPTTGSSHKESIYSEEPTSSKGSSTGTKLLRHCKTENQTGKLPNATDVHDDGNPQNNRLKSLRKKSETSFSPSEEKSSNLSVLSINSENDDDSVIQLNPLRHTRINAGSVWHEDPSKTSPYTRTSLKKKKKLTKKHKILKKQKSMDSIGAFSLSSLQSDTSNYTDSYIESDASTYIHNARSIDSFLDEGLANILEQPESETIHQENRNNLSDLKQETSSQQLDNLAIPDQMRLRSNTGGLLSCKHLKVEEDEFRQRAQSDLTEDKQKRILEKKKLQSLRNRKIKKGKSNKIILSESNLSPYSSFLSLSTDSSFSDISQEHDLKSLNLITHNNLYSSMESIDQDSTDCHRSHANLPDICRMSKSNYQLNSPTTPNRRKPTKRNMVDSATQTDDEIYIIQQENNGQDRDVLSRHDMEYPIIQIIRPSIDDSTNPSHLLRSPTQILTSHFPPINEDVENKRSQLCVNESSSFQKRLSNQRGSPQAVPTLLPKPGTITQTIKCSLIILFSFAFAYLPTCVVVCLLDRIPTEISLQLLVVARSIQYLYYSFIPKIYLYPDQRM